MSQYVLSILFQEYIICLASSTVAGWSKRRN